MIYFPISFLCALFGHKNSPKHFENFTQEWEKKAVEAKERYTKLIKEFEANGGDRNAGAGKKRSKPVKKVAAKKGKKRADSDDDDEEDESD